MQNADSRPTPSNGKERRKEGKEREPGHRNKKHTDIRHTMLSSTWRVTFNTDNMRVCKEATEVSEMGGCAHQR